jgi:hypothetical protein
VKEMAMSALAVERGRELLVELCASRKRTEKGEGSNAAAAAAGMERKKWSKKGRSELDLFLVETVSMLVLDSPEYFPKGPCKLWQWHVWPFSLLFLIFFD